MFDIRPQPALAVNGNRLLIRLQRLAEIGADVAGGITRPGFTAADREAVRHLAGMATAAGLVPTVDQAGNLIIRRPRAVASVPVLLMGSHLDTVVRGGPLDGAYGVVAALEVLQVLTEHHEELVYEPVAVAFANEEGARFPYPFWGSRALTGQLTRTANEVFDQAGRPLAADLGEVGGDPSDLAGACWPPGGMAAYLELHIEQGPVLERAGATIGVVESITGRAVIDVGINGCAGHAGTTPMDGRADALAAAARVVLAVEELARAGRTCAVATVGKLDVDPGVTNVVPGRVRLTAEVRDGDAARLRAAERVLVEEVARIAAATGTDMRARVTGRFAPVATDPWLRTAVAAAADDLGLSRRTLFSGAGHDAQIVAAAAPVGMIFVPSSGGVSHVPEESTPEADLVAGAQVLLGTALRCECRPV